MELDADRPRGAVPRPPISFIVAALLEVSGGRALAAPYIAAIDWILMACWALALGGTFALTAGAVELLCPSYRTLRGKNGTRTAYLIGYEASCLLSNFYLATAGAIAWFFLDLDAALHAEIPFAVVHILYPMLAHLISDLAIAVFLPEVREPAIIVHHVLTLILGVLALSNFAHFYCIFFAGLCELSNVPLAVLEVFKLVPDMKALHPQLVVRARHTFSLLFIPLRLIYWPLVSHSFWRASLTALGSGAEFNAVILFYLLANGSLTALQFAWGAQLIRGYLFRSRREKEE